MSKHTPGPWQISQETKRAQIILDNSGRVVIGSACGHPNSWCYPGEDNGDANARLMAAAPELLEALRDVLAAERAGSRTPDTISGAEKQLDRIKAAVAKAEAAIAKAEGKE